MQTSDSNQNNVSIVTPQATPRRRRIGKWLSLAVVVLVLGGGSVWWLLRDDSRTVEAEATATVEITAEGFIPETVKIKKGETITWINKDTQPHQTASDPHPTNDGLEELNSEEPLAEGESYTATFEEAGTFTYHDELNPTGIKATVVVE